MAGPALRVIMAAGKFHGVIAAVTPIACLITSKRWFGKVGVKTSPSIRRACSANQRMNDAA